MYSLNNIQLESNSKIKINFNGGDLSSDSGLLLIKEFAEKIGFHKIIRTLELKFDLISKNTRRYIESIEDINVIDRLFDKAIKTVSVESFEQFLEKVRDLE